ncbi:hypothetical protein ACEWY4_023575 [Coilia grayii]|uniref:MADF domain-containing protein n=1 Tax=Coilia grayii TaxID=363190 RepID=A0ABD1J3F7_9TELE
MVAKTKSKIPTEQLVVLVSEHTELYNMANKLYHNVYHKETVWRSIGTLLGHSWEDCCDKWKYLRGKYRKERKEAKERQSGAVGGPKTSWKYLNILTFLEPYIQDRPTASNCQVESETAETILNRMNSQATLSQFLRVTVLALPKLPDPPHPHPHHNHHNSSSSRKWGLSEQAEKGRRLLPSLSTSSKCSVQ